MTDLHPMPPTSPFDGIRHEDEQGEYWTARELMPMLEYSSWQKFEEVIERAIEDCTKSARNSDEHFNLLVKKTGGRPQKDYRLTRYACHLIVMAARTSGDVAAQARTYFSDKVDEAELAADLDMAYLEWRRRAILSYMARGYSREWSERRVDGITARNKLTHEWSVRGIKDEEFAILTDEIHMEMFDLTVNEHKGIKDFPVVRKGKKVTYKGDLREAMVAVESAVTALGETVARDLHIRHDSQGYSEISHDVHEAGRIAGNARREIEAITGEPVVSPRNMIREPDGGLWAQLPSPETEEQQGK